MGIDEFDMELELTKWNIFRHFFVSAYFPLSDVCLCVYRFQLLIIFYV